jgi:hypothetical protein
MKPLLAALTGLALAAPAFADPPWEKPFAVRDAHGVHMGRLLGAPDGGMGVQIRIGKQRYLVPLAAQRQDNGLPSPVALDYPFTYIFYAGQNCAGTAYTVDDDSVGMPLAVASAFLDGKVLLYPRGKLTELVTTNSVRLPDASCQNSVDANQVMVPVNDPIDITSLYARPFSVK